ncbi:MAG: SCP2 sterol-binding domain-containing protein [Alphaproteobacteria bacterium]|nr:SCP2 sterol-binding domain-containing protein [Alphaproteobacteria bacterium]
MMDDDPRAEPERDDRILETMAARLALLLAWPLPPALLQPPLDLVMAILKRRHPGAFERLTELPEAEIVVDPVDMPMAFRLRLGGGEMRLSVCRRDDIGEPAALVRGNFAVLLDLMEGRTDGDALFFSRELTVIGDTSPVVALRNAVDGEDIDMLADIAAMLGPFGRLVRPARGAASRARSSLVGLHDLLLGPALRRVEGVERRLTRLEGH